MDILTDKYKKIEGETAVPNNVQAGEMMAFVTVEEPALEDLDGEFVCGGGGGGGKREILIPNVVQLLKARRGAYFATL